jgi:hypothetical protein
MAQAETRRYAPYLAWRTLFNVIENLAEGPMPARIDRSYLSGRSGAEQTLIIATLKAWGLIGDDDNKALPRFLRLIAERDARPGHVEVILREQYPEVFALDPNATQAQLDERFREVFGLTGSTLRKAETFFLHAAGYAGIKLSPHFKAVRGIERGPGLGPRRARRLLRRQIPPMPPPINGSRPTDPAEARRQRYFDLLIKKADEAGEMDAGLLDRIERLLGMGVSEGEEADS